ncbi:MAG: putative integral membrane protein (TIGR00697 family) [Gammaproteobacteria bacterium]
MARALPPSPFWENPILGLDSGALESAFSATFFFPGLLIFASMLAYLVAQLFDVRLYHFWWKVTKGRHMWVRNNGSTMISQLADTIIVNGIYLHFGLKFDWATTWSVILAVYVCKLFLAVVDTPLIYLGRSVLRSYLGLPKDAAPGSAPLA